MSYLVTAFPIKLLYCILLPFNRLDSSGGGLTAASSVHRQTNQRNEGGGQLGGHPADGVDQRWRGPDGKLRGPHWRCSDSQLLHAEGTQIDFTEAVTPRGSTGLD